MPTTTRFGFELGSQMTDADKIELDAILASLEVHAHPGGLRVADPIGELTAALLTTGGHLAAAQTRHYRYSYIDQFGLETAASDEISVVLPGPVAAPDAPILTGASGGALPVGTVTYALSAVAGGVQTTLSVAAQITVVDLRTVHVQTTDDTFATGVTQYNVWRLGPRDGAYTLIGSMTDPTDTFIDDGSVPSNPLACDPTTQAPVANTTNGTNKITITNPDIELLANAPDNGIVGWRLYTSSTPGVYPRSSLLAEVRTFVNIDGSGGLIDTVTDDGTIANQPGQPQGLSRTLTPSHLVVVPTATSVSGLPDPALLRDGSLGAVMDGINSPTLYMTESHEWVPTLSGTADAGGPVRALGSDGTTGWAISATLDGALLTDTSASVPLGDLVLQDSAKVLWRVRVDGDGAIHTAVVTGVGAHDTLFEFGHEPTVPTPDASFAYLLTVDTVGALATSAIGVSHLAAVAESGSYEDLMGRPSLGGAASLDVGTTAGTVAAGDDPRLVGAAQWQGVWASGTTYGAGNLVEGSDDQLYASTGSSNIGHDPTTDGGVHWTEYLTSSSEYKGTWSSVTTYATGDLVKGSDNQLYASLAGGNLNHDPVSDGGVHWTAHGGATTAVAVSYDHTTSGMAATNVQAAIDELKVDDALKAPLANPSLTGVPVAPTASQGNNSTQLATTAYVDAAAAAAAVGLFDYRGTYNASGNAFPSSGGSGAAGAILKGDLWVVSTGGTLGGTAVSNGDLVVALVDTPGSTAANWNLVEHDIGYTPENTANKSTDATLAANSATLFPSQSAVKGYADGKVENSVTSGHTTIAPSGDAVSTALAAKAPLASPTFTGTPAAPTTVTSDSSTRIATTALVDAKIAAAGGSTASLVPTATKTANYTAAASDFVRCDTTSGAFTVTLPTPAANTQIGVRIDTLGVGNFVTVQASGSDVFIKSGGASSTSLRFLDESMILEYRAAEAVWVIIEHGFSRSTVNPAHTLSAPFVWVTLSSTGQASTGYWRYAVDLPFDVNATAAMLGVKTATGTARVIIFDSTGTTQLFDTGLVTLSGTGAVLLPFIAPGVLARGSYVVAVYQSTTLALTTAAVSVPWATTNTAGTIPSTVTPPTSSTGASLTVTYPSVGIM